MSISKNIRSTMALRRDATGRPSKTYNSWVAMKQRCNHPSQKSYKDYGGRGITYCKRWESFDNFLEDMGPRPESYTLDRKNVNGPYEESNCRWVSNIHQQNNRRNNCPLTYNGKTQTLAEWSRELGISKSTLHGRLRIGRWTTEQILTTPVNRTCRTKKAKPDGFNRDVKVRPLLVEMAA